jgi:hypothetical protein
MYAGTAIATGYHRFLACRNMGELEKIQFDRK